MLKKHALLISLAYTVSLFTISLIRLDFNEIDVVVPTYGDKVFHFAAYGLLTWFWFYTVYTKYNFTKIKALIVVSTACIVFGTIIEVLQKEITNTRFFDLYDIAANAGGVALAALVVLIYEKSGVK